DAARKPDSGCWFATKWFYQIVVASSSTHSILRTGRAIPEFENCLVVVVETADETRVRGVFDGEFIEILQEHRVVFLALRADELLECRSHLDEDPRVLLFGLQKSERVLFETPAILLWEITFLADEIIFECLHIVLAILGTAD